MVADVSVKCMVKGIVNRKSIICASTCISTDMGMKLAWKPMWGCNPPFPCGCPNCHRLASLQSREKPVLNGNRTLGRYNNRRRMLGQLPVVLFAIKISPELSRIVFIPKIVP